MTICTITNILIPCIPYTELSLCQLVMTVCTCQ